MNLQGTVIALEGPDGVGKTTISKMLSCRLMALGYEVDLFSFPGRGCSDLGTFVYDFHHKAIYGEVSVDSLSLQLLHAAAHIDLINNKVYPAIKNGHCVILDRYWWSLLAYGLHDNVSPHALHSLIDLEWMFLEKIEPVIVFLLDRNIKYQHHSALMHQYLTIYNEQKQRGNAFFLLNDNLSYSIDFIEDILLNLRDHK